MMTYEEWAASNSAPTMLAALYHQDAEQFEDLKPQLHRYFLACARKIEHLTPQKALREGVRGAEKWCEGLISDEELYRLDWEAEAEAFAIDYAKTAEELGKLKAMIHEIVELEGVDFSEARNVVKAAAYFVDGSMMYSLMNKSFIKSTCTSQFLCANLLREHVQPDFTSDNPN